MNDEVKRMIAPTVQATSPIPRPIGPSARLSRLMPILPAIIGVLVMGLFAYLGLNALDRVSRQAQLIVDRNLQNTVRISDIAARARELNGDFYRLATLRAANVEGIDVNAELSRLGILVDQLIADLRAFRDERASPAQVSAITEAIDRLGSYRQALEFVGSMLDLDFASAVTFIRPFNSLFDNLTALLQTMTESTVTDARQLSSAAGASTQEIGRWFLFISILVAAGVAIFGWLAGKRQERFVFSTTVLEREVADRTAALQTAKLQAESALDQVRRTQTQLVEAEKMAALGSLVAGVAHEINTPVGTSLTAATLLEDRTREFRTLVESNQVKRTDLARYLGVASETTRLMLTNIHRATELIQSFKQVAVDQTSAECRRFNLSAYIDEVLTSLRPNLRKAAAAVEVTCPLDIEMNSYPGALAQVLTNLVMNALIHAFDPDKVGTIAIQVVQLDNDRLQLDFHDNGKGIDAMHLTRVFDPFFTTRRGHGGSGLGLHIVYNIVTQQLGGSIKVASEVDAGTTFTLTVPISVISQGTG